MRDSGEPPRGTFWTDADGEQALQGYRSLVQAIDAGVFQLDAEGRVVAVNNAFLELTGHDGDDLLGEHVSLILDDEAYQQIERTVVGGPEADEQLSETFETAVQTVSGGTVPCELQVDSLVQDDESRGAVGIIQDRGERDSAEAVAGRREREGERAEHEEPLSSLIDNVPGMVYRCRNERGWPMEFVSEACEAVTGYAAEALERGDLEWGSDVVVQEDREMLWETVQREASEGETFSETYRIQTAAGETRWVRDYGRGIFRHGDLVEIEGIISDVTERKRTEQRLKEERDMFADGPVVVFRWDPDEEAGWPVEYVSRNVEDVFGYSPENLESGEVPYVDLLFDEELDRIAREVEENSDGSTERFSHDPTGSGPRAARSGG
jgi:PAS domain S-box-containing protein